MRRSGVPAAVPGPDEIEGEYYSGLGHAVSGDPCRLSSGYLHLAPGRRATRQGLASNLQPVFGRLRTAQRRFGDRNNPIGRSRIRTPYLTNEPTCRAAS